MKMRAFALTMLSVAFSAGVFYNAYAQKKQFYPSVVYITKSSFSMAILYIQAFVLVFLAGKLFRKIFFGQLRAAEMEHLIERSWYAVTETCLAFTVFRDDFSPRFVALFTLLLFTKSFHWLADDRIDYMERSPVISVLFHARAIGLMFMLSMMDSYFVNLAYNNTLIKGPSVQLVFGFEYAILLTMVMQVSIKYILHTIDLHSENPWENKAVYLLYSELLMGLSKVCLYLLFLVIMMKVHTFPLFVVRPMYLTVREFKKALNDVFMSRRAIHNMNTLYPTATEEELAQGDNVCIICREEMSGVQSGPAKKLPCNHIFHTTCLRSWFQRQQTCPTCRMDVFRTATNARNLRQQQQQQQAPQPPQQPPQPQPQPQQQQPQPHPLNFNQFFQNFVPPQMGPAVRPPTSPLPQQPPSSSQMPHPPFPPFIPPFFQPFGMPPPPPVAPPSFLTVPPPITPDQLSSMTDDELRLMEDQSRRGIEARVKCLNDVQTLLSAAMLQMNHYLQAVQVLQPPLLPTSTSSSSPSSSSSSPSSSSSSFTSLSNSSCVFTSSGSQNSTSVPQPSSSSQPSSSQPSSSPQPSSSSQPSSSPENITLSDKVENNYEKSTTNAMLRKAATTTSNASTITTIATTTTATPTTATPTTATPTTAINGNNAISNHNKIE